MYKELAEDIGFVPPDHGELINWAKQGVLMLNSVLTVRSGEANSHKGMGWEIFTDRVIQLLNQREKPIVFLLWGANARRKKDFITNPRHKVLEAAHPSPLSAYNGFFGCRHFSKTNEILKQMGETPIDWTL
jgi:uracil-DNA glycosylase